ncbi:MAG: DUF58 domain-containing protein [Actinomycetota bacterium]
MALTSRAALAAALATVVVAVLPLPVKASLALVDGALIALIALDALLAHRPASIGLVREAPSHLGVGERGGVRLRLANPWPRPAHCLLYQALPGSLRPSARRRAVAVPALGEAEMAVEIRPRDRGRIPLGTVTVRLAGPLRLAARQRRFDLGDLLKVYPPFASKREADLRVERGRLLEVGLRSAPGRGGGTEFDSLRDYHLDDEFRRIDWSATARSGKAIARDYRAERSQPVIMLLDTGRTMAGRVAGVTRLEHALDAVLTLTTLATRLGDRAGLVAFAQDVRATVSPSASRLQFGRVVEAVYTLDARLAESDYANAVAATLARFPRRALLVLLTELADEAVTSTILRSLPLALRHHLVVIASVADPAVEALARATPQDARAAYRQAAALSAMADRASVAARMQALGALVVDAPPGALAPRLADAYLDVKARGRL